MPTSMDLNDRAVALLQERRQREAAWMLRRSLKCLLSEVMEYSKVQVSSSLSAITNNSKTDMYLPVYTVPIYDTTLNEIATSPGNVFSIFNRAFVIQNDPRDSAAFLSEYGLETTALLLYNMGLSRQKQAVVDNDSHSFKQALHYYKVAYRTVMQVHDKADDELELARCILLALTNNMGFIYEHFCMHQESQSCRNLLAELLASFPSYVMLTEEEFTFYSMSISYFFEVDTITAPAA